MTGTFENPQEEGSMSIFTTREAAEEFVAGDPFVLNGVIRSWEIRGSILQRSKNGGERWRD